MRQVNTYRIAQEEMTLPSAEAQGMAERELFSSDTVHLKECRSVVRTSWLAKACALYLLTAGELKLKDGKLISQGEASSLFVLTFTFFFLNFI